MNVQSLGRHVYVHVPDYAEPGESCTRYCLILLYNGIYLLPKSIPCSPTCMVAWYWHLHLRHPFPTDYTPGLVGPHELGTVGHSSRTGTVPVPKPFIR